MVRLTNQFWDIMWGLSKNVPIQAEGNLTFVKNSNGVFCYQEMENNLVKIKEKELDFIGQLYIDLFETTYSSLKLNIEKTRIEKVILKVIETFLKDSYNNLLLYSYSLSKENYVAAHITNTVILTIGFGASLNLSKSDLLELGIAAFCHDFGMLDYITLYQSDMELQEKEVILLRRHPLKSVEIFKPYFSESILNMILDVHEHVNGTGYPNGKQGDSIAFFSRIISVCDVFEALTHPRNFRKAYSPFEAMKMIIKQKNIIFDMAVVRKFLEYMSIYPVGSLVYLNSGETAMVVGGNRGYPTRSIVKILLNSKHEIISSDQYVNLLENKRIYINGPLDPLEENKVLNCIKPRGHFEI